jgi:hypothetical protein
LIIKIQGYFQFGQGWYRGSEVRDLVLQYYFVLRSVLRAKPCLRRCLTRCRHCQIFFLTNPCNAGRKDLGCPFGCKDAHRKRGSIKRSVEYYSTPEGKFKKKLQNDKRGMADARAVVNDCEPAGSNLMQHECRFDAPVLCYLRMVITLIEGRRVSAAELLEMLARVLRQHSIARRRRIDYVLQYLKEHSP